ADRSTAACARQVISYVESRSPAAGHALVQAMRDGKVGFQALFANLLTGILDHDTFARVAWPAGLLAREHGLGMASAQITDVPGQTLTFPMVLAASGVRYLASGVNPERAVPLLPDSEAARHGLAGEWTAYPQLCWGEAPDGSRVLPWRPYYSGDARRTSSATWNGGSARSSRPSAATPACTGRTAPPRRLPTWPATAPCSSPRGPPTCWPCGTSRRRRGTPRARSACGAAPTSGGR